MSAAVVIKKNAKPIKDSVGKVKDLSKEPFFVKKAEEAKAFLKKHGRPFAHDSK